MKDPVRPAPAPWIDTTHTVALALWLSALVLGGASAAVMFPTMKAVQPFLADFPGSEADHWKIAAGIVQQRIFLVSDTVQFVAGIAAFFTLGVRLIGVGVPQSPRRPATVVRALAVGCAMLLLSYHLLVLAPRMSDNLTTYYDLARAGRLAEADIARGQFETDHPTASRVLGATTLCVIAALVASVWSLARPRDEMDTTPR